MIRALVLSDIHGEESQLRWMLEETWKMTGKIDGYFFLGDGVDDFAQAENFIRRRDPDALMLDVRGNNDFDMDVPLFAVVTVGGVRMYLTHGHRERVSMLHSGLVPARAREEGCSFAFFGHTHRMMAEREQGVFVCNPGSISLPRGGPASYARLDIEGGMLRTLELVDEDGALLRKESFVRK